MQYRGLWNSQAAGGVTRRCVAGTDTQRSASEVGLKEVRDRAGDSETGVKFGWEDAMVNHVEGSNEV
jgi:hypothetical protein